LLCHCYQSHLHCELQGHPGDLTMLGRSATCSMWVDNTHNCSSRQQGSVGQHLLIMLSIRVQLHNQLFAWIQSILCTWQVVFEIC
jgi:hypothetical protein